MTRTTYAYWIRGRAFAEHFNLMDVCLGPDSMWWVKKPLEAA